MTKESASSVLENLKARIRHKQGPGMARGELWLGTELFSASGQADTPEAHLAMADQLGHSLVCLPVSHPGALRPDLGYRYFTAREAEQAAGLWDGPVLAVLDGPFQEMVNQMGLMAVLTGWMQAPEKISRCYAGLSEQVLSLVSGVLETPVAGLVFADDFASDAGPMVRPEDLSRLCAPFYQAAVSRASRAGVPVLLHSCGSLSRLMPMFLSWQLGGFAAVQSRVNDLGDMYRRFEGKIVILGGIEQELLESPAVKRDAAAALSRLPDYLFPDLILGSSCGLYRGSYLEQVPKIYRAADTLIPGQTV